MTAQTSGLEKTMADAPKLFFGECGGCHRKRRLPIHLTKRDGRDPLDLVTDEHFCDWECVVSWSRLELFGWVWG